MVEVGDLEEDKICLDSGRTYPIDYFPFILHQDLSLVQ